MQASKPDDETPPLVEGSASDYFWLRSCGGLKSAEAAKKKALEAKLRRIEMELKEAKQETKAIALEMEEAMSAALDIDASADQRARAKERLGVLKQRASKNDERRRLLLQAAKERRSPAGDFTEIR